MLVLVTGAFGNIGRHTVDSLLEAGHRVRAMVHESDVDQRELQRRWGTRVEVVHADLTAPATLTAAVKGAEVVVHLAFMIPPECLEKPELARRTNVDGTRALLEATGEHAPGAKFLFASTLDVYGHTNHLPPPRRVDDPTQATDVYSTHKLEAEALVRSSQLTWGILRFADVPPLKLRGPVPIMFDIPLSQRIHAIHPDDAGLATARAAAHELTWGKVWHIGGDASCQLTYGAYLGRFLQAMGMGGPLPEAAFCTSPYCTDWLDTDESQRVFQYQRKGFDVIVADIAALLGWRRPFTALARPFVRRQMLGLSPYWKLPPGAPRVRGET